MTFHLKRGMPEASFDSGLYPGFLVMTYHGRKYVSRRTHPRLVVLHGNDHHLFDLRGGRAYPVKQTELERIQREYYQFPPLFIKAQLLEHFTVIDMGDKEVSVAEIHYETAEMFLTNIINPMIKQRCPSISARLVLEDRVAQKQALFHLPGTSLHLVLCLYRRTKCISSITFSFYPQSVLIESKTDPQEENKKYNTLLRAITILLSDKLVVRNQAIRSIQSQPIHWVSAWLLHSKFGFQGSGGTTRQIHKEEFRRRFDQDRDYELEITGDAYRRAWNVLETTLKTIACE